MRSTALSTAFAAGLTLALGLSASAETDKPEKPAVAHATGKPAAKKTTEKPAKPTTEKSASKHAADKPAAKPSAAKRAADKPSDKSTTKGKPPLPNSRPVARDAVPKTIPPSPATAPGREAGAPLSPSTGGPAPAARQRVTAPTPARKPGTPAAIAATSTTSKEDLDRLEEVIELIRKHRPDDATQAEAAISDPVARKLAEWLILRSDNNNATVERYRAFLSANPSWPSQTFLRRRLEASLWDDKRDDAVVWSWFENESPISAKGRLALAKAMLARGDRANAERLVREAFRNDPMSEDTETSALDLFGPFVTGGDQKARMDLFSYTTENEAAAMRAARRLGSGYVALAKARNASVHKAANTKALLDAVPHELRNDAGYLFAKIQELRRAEKYPDAAQLMLSAPRDPARLYNLDEWWVERRLLARKMIDSSEFKTAYLIARDAALPSRDIYKTEQEFTAGWVALRFLNDPATAAQHFARIGVGSVNPTTLARAGYWKGRAAEAMGRSQEARAHYTSAAGQSTSYYGQLARAKLGLPQLGLNEPPRARGVERLEVVRAAQLLFDLDERDIAIPIFADMGENGDVDVITGLGELTARFGYARGMILVGKAALNRGMPFDFYAYPVMGIPSYSPIGPDVEKSVVFAIARQESQFNQGDVSPAQAYGLMQVTPDAGRYVCKRAGVPFDLRRLKTDSAYNAALGAAELGGLLEDFRGSYIMTFAAYNAGRGSLKKWIDRYGDPRDPKVDAVDWVELIPFSETRNYVQRIMENLQVYRARFGGGTRLQIEADLHRGSVE
ncbi:MAG TPA: transglycosylase SLT domain-containing protein [Bradyrhizobium sp.]